jgi:hypothetical protein
VGRRRRGEAARPHTGRVPKIKTVADAGLLPRDDEADWFNVALSDFLS